MKLTRIITAVALIAGLGSAATAQAAGWRATHPRRAEVNSRLNYQNYRIRQGVRSGRLTTAQAHQLHADDHSIRTEERADASVNGGHITRAEQRQINQQENANSTAIYDEKHPR